VETDRVEGSPVAEVVVDGKRVVAGGELVNDDLEAIRAHAREQAARLWSRMT
jgi:phosphotransferase system IIA component